MSILPILCVVKHATRDLVLADQLVNVNTSDELSALRARMEGDRVR